MSKEAATDHPIHELIASRWSPYHFADESISSDDLRSLFEAARWSASSYNEQPWRYIVATRDEPELFEKVLGCLVEGNQGWAKNAPVLLLTVASTTFARNGKPNGAAVHDVGLASATLTFEATARGLAVHQMSGIKPDHARDVFQVPDGFEVVTAVAIGKPGDPAQAPEELRPRDEAPRSRRPLAETVFGGDWGKPSSVLG